MKKILVATDYSTNSKAAMRFAIQLSLQEECELTFFHMYAVMTPASWSDAIVMDYGKIDNTAIQQKLEKFVASLYNDMGIRSKKYKCAIKQVPFTDGGSLLQYAMDHKFNYICVGTKGAGRAARAFGSTASYLIKHSGTPVIAVPSGYRPQKISHLLYASDFQDYKKELKKVAAFAQPLNAKVELLHFYYPVEAKREKNIQNAVKSFSKLSIKLHTENVNVAESFISNLNHAVKRSKPSLLILFTEQHRTLFEKIFLASMTAEYSFDSKVPMLIFGKS